MKPIFLGIAIFVFALILGIIIHTSSKSIEVRMQMSTPTLDRYSAIERAMQDVDYQKAESIFSSLPLQDQEHVLKLLSVEKGNEQLYVLIRTMLRRMHSTQINLEK